MNQTYLLQDGRDRRLDAQLSRTVLSFIPCLVLHDCPVLPPRPPHMNIKQQIMRNGQPNFDYFFMSYIKLL